MSERQTRSTGGAATGGPQTGWTDQVPVICNACDWRYLTPPGRVPERCPHCAANQLAVLDPGEADFPYVASPELVVPFSVSAETLDHRILEFADGIPLPPPDLNPATLTSRLTALYLPMWLVDCDVQTRWQAEVGFDYEVVSHQERYADGAGWRTAEVRETRVRWEPRVGHLSRHYDNVDAPALSTHETVRRLLGTHDRRTATAFEPGVMREALVRVPDRAPDAAWPEAEMGVRQRAIAECREAAGADHLREFRWAPTYANRAWTLLLLPVYATFYRDDAGTPQQVLINGQTGQLTGMRRGSLARAHRRSLITGIVALVLFVLSLAVGLGGMLFPPLVVVGIVGALGALMVGAAAFVPTVRVTIFNRREAERSPEM